MNEKELKFNIGEPVTSASHDTAAIDIVKDEDRNRRKSFMKLLVVGFMLIVVVVFGALGWFSANKQNTASGASIKVADAGFELAVDSGDETYKALYSMLDAADIGDGLKTGNEGQTIWWRMESDDGSLQPGSHGTLEFYVEPKGETVGELKYSLSVRAFKADTSTATVTENDSTYTVETVTGLDEITSSYTSNDSKADINAMNGKDSLVSHIMFFTGENNGQYYGFINNKNSFSLVLDRVDETNTYKGKIYWVWPKFFGQIVSSSSIEGNLPLLDQSSAYHSTDIENVNNYLSSNASMIFRGINNVTIYLGSDERANTQSEAYMILSEGYNNADQIIGDNLDYSLISLTVDIG